MIYEVTPDTHYVESKVQDGKEGSPNVWDEELGEYVFPPEPSSPEWNMYAFHLDRAAQV